MSRSNGNGVPPNGWPADYPPADGHDPYQDPYYAPQQQRPAAPPQPQHGQYPQQPPAQTAGRPPRIQGVPPSRTPQPGLPPAGPPQQGYPPQGQHPGQGYAPQPTYAPPQPRPAQQPTYAPNPYQQAAPQAPQGAYAPVPPQGQRTAPPVRTAPPAQAPMPDPRYAAYQGYDAGPVPAAPARPPQSYPGYLQDYGQQAQAPYQPPQAYVPETTGRPTQPPQQAPAADPRSRTAAAPQYPQADPHGYDLGTYMPNTPAADPRSQRPTQPGWPQHAEPELQRQPEPSLGYGSPYPGDAPAARGTAVQHVEDDADYNDHDDHDEYDEPPRRTRYGLIAASLIGAIAAGGGLAYAYKFYVAPPSQMAAAPVIKSGTGPVKVKPADPGGTKFANTDSKMMEQLSNSQSSASDGPRAVRTIPVERDGSIRDLVPPAQTGSVNAGPVAAQPVPGMMVVMPPRAEPPPAAAPVAVQPPPAAKPRVVAAAAPPPAPAVDETAAAPPPPPAKKVAVKKPVPPSAVGGPPTGANGFVAVLASVPASGNSRMQAMQQFADLQQKFGGVLGAKAPDVIEANLGEKGTYHRLVVGPPASRDAATSVCSQLKAAGYTADCWVTGF
jgi:SPOR domain